MHKFLTFSWGYAQSKLYLHNRNYGERAPNANNNTTRKKSFDARESYILRFGDESRSVDGVDNCIDILEYKKLHLMTDRSNDQAQRCNLFRRPHCLKDCLEL